jgi:hypothetical protein
MPGLWFQNLWPDSERSSDIRLFGRWLPVVDENPVAVRCMFPWNRPGAGRRGDLSRQW